MEKKFGVRILVRNGSFTVNRMLSVSHHIILENKRNLTEKGC